MELYGLKIIRSSLNNESKIVLIKYVLYNTMIIIYFIQYLERKMCLKKDLNFNS